MANTNIVERKAAQPSDRYLFHSFPRPRRDEARSHLHERSLRILSYMNEVGLVLAPEVVRWNVDAISGGEEKLEILQRRMCFTELSVAELPEHQTRFGPLTLACDIQGLRDAGAGPVIYTPQGEAENAASQISTFAVRGTYHTHAVLKQLRDLRNASDPKQLEAHYGMPVAPNYTLNLRNTGPDGAVVAGADVPAAHVQQVMQHVGFNNISFDHSVGVLEIFLNMFYPTDNQFADEQLGYYRQREWRFIGADLVVKGHQIARPLTAAEQTKLLSVDEAFWGREETVDGTKRRRSELALLYQPTPNWRFWDVVDKVLVPEEILLDAKSIAGDKAVTALA